MVDFGLPLADIAVLYPVSRGRDSHYWVLKLDDFQAFGTEQGGDTEPATTNFRGL